MIDLATKRQLGLCMISASLSALAGAANIYRAENADGTFRYASQPLDASYALYLKGDPEPSTDRLLRTKSSPLAGPKRATLEPLIQQLAQKHAVEAALVRAIIEVESDFNPQAISPKGAMGAMQLMPATAARYGANHRSDPAQNIEAGIRYLKDLLALYNGNVALALASYNAGEGAVARYGGRIPPYKETMLYVPAVLIKLQNTRNAPTP